MNYWKEHPATNRQRKVLRLFNVPIASDITKGLAARYITGIFADPKHRDRWNKYVFLTEDTERDSSDLKPFNPTELERLVLPPDWEKRVSRNLNSSFEARAESIWAEASPFDDPEPILTFSGKHFCFTGKFEFGARKGCKAAIERLGGIADPDVNHGTDYLIIGKLGSERFAKDGYGRKIEWAIIAKFENGSPLLISEDHWSLSLRNEANT
jgi:NAD-dependent DNA ligase